MSWHCRLYGHQLRHPGEFEVVVSDDTPPTHPFECALCGYETLMAGSRTVYSGAGNERSDSIRHGR